MCPAPRDRREEPRMPRAALGAANARSAWPCKIEPFTEAARVAGKITSRNGLEDQMRFERTGVRRGVFGAALVLGLVLASILVNTAATGGAMEVERNKQIARRWSEELWGQGNL